MNKLENIGFYTLSDERARCATHKTPLWRCELVLTSRCNFKCPYCRNVGGEDVSYADAAGVVKLWAEHDLKNVRFSGGEPTLWAGIFDLVGLSKELGIGRVAVSTNGSAGIDVYSRLLERGVDDFSVSLDACCAEDAEKMTGGVRRAFDIVSKSIAWLSKRAYTTVGVVLTDDNVKNIGEIISYADSLGVSDIRIIPAAQSGNCLGDIKISQHILNKYPILRYRIANIEQGRAVRGLCDKDSSVCGLVLDDIAINHDKHYPCIIYMREKGEAIGNVGKNMRQERLEWYQKHNTKEDPICKKNCLDVCIDYNNTFAGRSC